MNHEPYKIKLWIDDERVEPRGWLRSSDAANSIQIINDYGELLEAISFDHDIGSSGNGADVASHLENLVKNEKIPTNLQFNIHSKNPGGIKDIKEILKRILQSWSRDPSEIKYLTAQDIDFQKHPNRRKI